MRKILELLAVLTAAITFGTAYYLLFLAHPVWVALPFEAFLPVFQELILRIGMSQASVSTVCIFVSLALFLMTREKAWLLVILFLLVSLPVTILFLMPINVEFLEWIDPSNSENSQVLLKTWGNYQIIRTIADGLALVAVWMGITGRPRASRL